ncbi:MAG: CpsD/CapB family tyrosine-protein kinase [Chloroflexi bacterium]|nr:CpsD/CapB family tyrosine-protein kinase [Chloroflexota bacterium]
MTETSAKPSDLLITLSDPRSPISEAYRTLRTNLQFVSLDKPLQTLLVTSPGPDEGKSTVLANLAIAVAQGEKKVILVDCDLRRPNLHRLFGLAHKVGLTTMMVDDKAMETPPLQETALPGLLLLASGPLPPSPSDLLGSQRMDRVLDVLRERADMVLLDAPPTMAVSDAAVLATKVDGVLLVVSAGHTRRESVQGAKAKLEKVNAHLLGVVLNNVPLDASLERYYYTGQEREE